MLKLEFHKIGDKEVAEKQMSPCGGVYNLMRHIIMLFEITRGHLILCVSVRMLLASGTRKSNSKRLKY